MHGYVFERQFLQFRYPLDTLFQDPVIQTKLEHRFHCISVHVQDASVSVVLH